MEKKLKELALKTGMSEREVSKFARAGMLGALAMAVAGLFGCVRNAKTIQAPPEPTKSAISKPVQETVNNVLQEVRKSTEAALPDVINPGDESCGPYPGYPCGTRYFTVSPADFTRLA